MSTPLLGAQEAVAIRERLGLSPEALDAELGLMPGTVASWENGSMRVPDFIAVTLRWRAAAAERSAALAASGLPECEWLRSWEAMPLPTKMKDRSAHLTQAIEHEKSCSVCQDRTRYIQERFGPMPPAPMPTWLKAFAWYNSRLERLPEWARPAGWVAPFFGVYTTLQVLVRSPHLTRQPKQWLIDIAIIAASTTIGALVGLAGGVVHGFRRRRATHGAT